MVVLALLRPLKYIADHFCQQKSARNIGVVVLSCLVVKLGFTVYSFILQNFSFLFQIYSKKPENILKVLRHLTDLAFDQLKI